MPIFTGLNLASEKLPSRAPRLTPVCQTVAQVRPSAALPPVTERASG